MIRRRHRLSGRLFLLFLVTAILVALVVRTGFRYGVEGSFRELAAPHLGEYFQHLLTELGNPPRPECAARLAARLPLEIHLLGASNWSSAGRPPAFPNRRSITRILADGTPVELARGSDGFLIRVRRDGVTVLLMGRDLRSAGAAPLAAVLTILVTFLLLLVFYHLIRRLFRPIETIQAGIARIGAGDLDHRLAICRRDELGELARGVNAMADDIRDMLEAKRQLLLAISHELRSPLTRARVNLELVPDGPPQRALRADLAQLESLLGELLESERLRAGHAVLAREAVDPTRLLTDLVAESFPDAGLRLALDPPGTWLPLDPARIRLMVRNLLRNAIRYTPAGGPAPTLASRADQDRWMLSVSDRGPGIDTADRERLTEPFYRADPSRQRGSGGVGLGLYLSRAIAEAHGGTLAIESRPDEGTRVQVTIPVSGHG